MNDTVRSRGTAFAQAVTSMFLFVSCNYPMPMYDDPVMVAALEVTPTATESVSFGDQSTDAFQDATFIVTNKKVVGLRYANTADEGQPRLQTEGDNAAIADQINDVRTMALLITVNDPSKFESLTVEGKTLRRAALRYGAASSPRGALTSGKRLPGYFGFIDLGHYTVPAQGQRLLTATVKGSAGLAVHIDGLGEAWAKRVFVTKPGFGTTIQLVDENAEPTPTPAPAGTPAATPMGSTPTPTPVATPTPAPATPSPTPGTSTPTPAPFQTYTLSVTRTGNGSGLVSSGAEGLPLPISCGNRCSSSFTEGSIVTLTAQPDLSSPYNLFLGWSGACSGLGLTCTVEMTKDQAVVATFGHISSIRLTARKTYTPEVAWFDGSFELPQPASLRIPEYLYVATGNGGLQWSTLDLGTTVCCYRGGADQGRRTDPIEPGRKFRFDRCLTEGVILEAGLDPAEACATNKLSNLNLSYGDSVNVPAGPIVLRVDTGTPKHPVQSPEALIQTTIEVNRWLLQ